MGTITTTTNTTPFQFPGNRLAAKMIDYNRWVALVKNSTANSYSIYRSTDGGSSWSPFNTFSRSNITDLGSIWVDNQGWLFWAFRTNESSADNVFVRRFETGPSNKPDTGEQLVASAANGGVAGAALTGVDLCSHYTSYDWHFIPVVVGTTRGSQQGISLVAAQIDTDGTISNGTYRFSGTREWLYTDDTIGRVGATIDKEHNGDGISAGSSPSLWAAFGRNKIRMVKIPWSGDGWTGPPGSTVLRTSAGARDTIPGIWDGNRYLVAVPDNTTGNTDKVAVFERNRANSATTNRLTPAHTTGVVRQATISYDYATGNCRVFAVGTSTAVLYSVDYIRATGLWGTWSAVSGSPAISGAGVDNFGVKRGTWQDASYGPYYATGTPTLTLTYTPQSQSYSPNTPTWEAPSNGAAGDVNAALLLDWSFTDPDPSDTQSAYALQRQIGAGTLNYWNAGTTTWGASEVFNTSSTTSVSLASGWAAGSDANYTFKVRVRDAASNSSSYSAGLVVIPSVKVNPAITAPTAAQVITTDHVTLTWTATEQTQYRTRLDVQGGSQVYDSGWITDSATRSVVIPYTLPNSTAWTVKIQTANNEGLGSNIVTQNFSVSFTPPATPTVVNSPRPLAGDIQIKITNPTPTGGQPTIALNEVWRRVAGTTATVRLSSNTVNNGTLNDIQTVSGVSYEYQVIAVGSNGTSTSGAWSL